MRTTLDVDIPRDPKAPRLARRAVEDLGPAIAGGRPRRRRPAGLRAVTNSVKYGGSGDLRLQIEAPTPRRLRIEVVDQGSGFEPVARSAPKTEPGGWGLHLVETLADRWGVHEGSTHVWFEIDR